jgi:hypothetical protein
MMSRILSESTLKRDHARRVLGGDLARRGEDGVHLAEDVQARLQRLLEGDLHDLLGDALDLDVHLQRGNAFGGTGHLEVHVAEVILVAEDIRQDRELVAVLDQAHGDTGNRRLERHTGGHQRQGADADRRHGAGAVGLGDLGHHANRVGELLFRRQHGGQAAARQAP